MKSQTPATIAVQTPEQEKKIMQMCKDFFNNMSKKQQEELFKDIEELTKGNTQTRIIEKGDVFQQSLFRATKEILMRMASCKTNKEVFEEYFLFRKNSPEGFLVYDLNDSQGDHGYAFYMNKYLRVDIEKKILFPNIVNQEGHKMTFLSEDIFKNPCWQWMLKEVEEIGTNFHIPYGDKKLWGHKNVLHIFPNLPEGKKYEKLGDKVGYRSYDESFGYIGNFNFCGWNLNKNVFVFPSDPVIS